MEMLNVAFAESSMTKTSVYKWYNRFQGIQEYVKDGGRPGRFSTSTINDNAEKVKKMIMDNLRLTVREITEHVGISSGS